ncbi:hypothetical protein [Pedobacter sp. FW305-3-2-15-E-R2A2]|uniref:hypothetical protein n=1 Tax=Pedobacter sp. FW305-3-2-15-E-R2A2 TaxID=3140251 RepID=UPI003140629D
MKGYHLFLSLILFHLCSSCSLKKEQSKKTVYLSDIDITYRAIDSIQRKFGDTDQSPLKRAGFQHFTKPNAFSFYISEMERITGKLGEEEKAFYKKLFYDYIPLNYPTPLQDPLQYMIYTPLIRKIESSSKTILPGSNYSPKYGTYYHNSIEAERKSAKNDYLILIHSRYITFCHQMGKVALQFYKNSNENIDIPDTSIIKSTLRSAEEIPMNFLYTFLEFNYPKFPINDSLLMETQPWLRRDFVSKAVQYWNNANETFLIGHEYSHALLKHKIDAEDGNELMNDALNLQSWQNELQADSLSQEILCDITANGKKDSFQMGWNKYLLYGGLFYLNTLKIYEDGQYVMANGMQPPKLSQSDYQTIMQIIQSKGDLNNLKRFASLGSAIKSKDHPPTEIRIELIERQISKLLSHPYYQQHDIDDYEEKTKILAERMLFALREMNAISGDAFLNAYKLRDTLNQKYR